MPARVARWGGGGLDLWSPRVTVVGHKDQILTWAEAQWQQRGPGEAMF